MDKSYEPLPPEVTTYEEVAELQYQWKRQLRTEQDQLRAELKALRGERRALLKKLEQWEREGHATVGIAFLRRHFQISKKEQP